MVHCPRRLFLESNQIRDNHEDAETVINKHQLSEVNTLARQLFPDGQSVAGTSLESAVLKTKELIQNGCTTIFNAHLEVEDKIAVIDILNLNFNWEVIEVLPISMRDVRDFLIKDSAEAEFKHKLKGIAFNLKIAELYFKEVKCVPYVLGINSNFIKNGEILAESIFEKANLEAKIAPFLSEMEENVEKIRSQKEDPNTMVGSHCKNPICPFRDFCWNNLGEDSIHNIPRISPKKREEFISRGWNSIKDIPEASLASDLTEIQRGAVKNIKSGRVLRNPMKLTMFTNRLTYPIYYLDFEAFQPVIPLFDNSKPFDMVPFQYSLHVEERVGRELKLTHTGYLHTTKDDPRRPLAERLVNELGDRGSIMVYNKTFENGVIEYLAQLFPDLADSLRKLPGRVVDLMVPFKEQQYFHPGMGFSYSLKAVQPALVPELSYKEEVVQNGAQAMQAYWEILETSDDIRRDVLIKGLDKYCSLDTLVMVEIIKVLRSGK